MNMKALLGSFVLVILSVTLFQCEAPCTRTVSQSRINAVDQVRLQQDIATIDAYLEDRQIVAIEDPTGIRYTIELEGSGAKPCIENSVTVNYRGKLLSTGAQFDASTSPVSFPLSNLILGWQIVLPQLKAGSAATIYIPSGFGYGPGGAGSSIPANANLIFEIQLIR
jgi:FKBP-type peptidyl-prolyl cis-trans isomerase FkpA